MQENSIDELRRFFGRLKNKYRGKVKDLSREVVRIDADMDGLKYTDDASIDRIIDAIKHYF